MATEPMPLHSDVIMGVALVLALIAERGLIALITTAIGEATTTPRRAIARIENELEPFVKG